MCVGSNNFSDITDSIVQVLNNIWVIKTEINQSVIKQLFL